MLGGLVEMGAKHWLLPITLSVAAILPVAVQGVAVGSPAVQLLLLLLVLLVPEVQAAVQVEV
jgi:hypothetical protein